MTLAELCDIGVPACTPKTRLSLGKACARKIDDHVNVCGARTSVQCFEPPAALARRRGFCDWCQGPCHALTAQTTGISDRDRTCIDTLGNVRDAGRVRLRCVCCGGRFRNLDSTNAGMTQSHAYLRNTTMTLPVSAAVIVNHIPKSSEFPATLSHRICRKITD